MISFDEAQRTVLALDHSGMLARGLAPEAEIIGAVALAALGANAAVLVLLWRHRADDINMRSAWLCSRNDVIANAGVLLAALGVGLSGSAWSGFLRCSREARISPASRCGCRQPS